MLAKLFSATLFGIDAKIISVEVDVSNGLPTISIVGLADASIKESRERVRACLRSLGRQDSRFKYPISRISVNLGPAYIYKYGTQFDLPIALGVLAAARQFSKKADEVFSNSLFLGELSLDGSIRPINGALSMIVEAQTRGIKRIFLPVGNSAEASLIKGIEIFQVSTLSELCSFLWQGDFSKTNNFFLGKLISPELPCSEDARSEDSKVKSNAKIFFAENSTTDFSEIAGLDFAKRGLEISAAGNHNIIFYGSPGTGKSLLSGSLASLMPDLLEEKLLQVAKIYGSRGLLNTGQMERIPYRAPHHSSSLQSFLGGGRNPMPGEISLAHNGILFLDELAEFPRNILEALRDPIESGKITISRAQGSVIFPSNFILVSAHNPCPCGFYGDKTKECKCTPGQIQKYTKKISGPILDRIDLHIRVEKSAIRDFSNQSKETSLTVRRRVIKAREIQKQRFGKEILNGQLSGKEILKFVDLDEQAEKLILKAEQKYNFSARTYLRILKIARTIADLRISVDALTSQKTQVQDLAEALQYRFSPDSR